MQPDGPPSHKEWTACLHSGHGIENAGNPLFPVKIAPFTPPGPASERPLEKRRSNQQRADAEDKKIEQVVADRDESAVLE